MSLPKNLFIVRHGESVGNLAKRKSENGDHSLLQRLRGTHTAHWPLTQRGKNQAESAGVFLNRFAENERLHFDRVYVSSYVRAMQTAGLLDLRNANWAVDPRIVERNWGTFDRYTDEERREKFSEVLHMREVEPFFWAPPEGETFNSLIIRLRDFISSLGRGSVDAENVAVVCHGEVMKAFRIIFTEMTIREYADMEFSSDPLERIHNCQIDHYTRRNPQTRALSHRLEWSRVYRPSEEEVDLSARWIPLPHRRFKSGELLLEALKLAESFKDIKEAYR